MLIFFSALKYKYYQKIYIAITLKQVVRLNQILNQGIQNQKQTRPKAYSFYTQCSPHLELIQHKGTTALRTLSVFHDAGIVTTESKDLIIDKDKIRRPKKKLGEKIQEEE